MVALAVSKIDKLTTQPPTTKHSDSLSISFFLFSNLFFNSNSNQLSLNTCLYMFGNFNIYKHFFIIIALHNFLWFIYIFFTKDIATRSDPKSRLSCQFLLFLRLNGIHIVYLRFYLKHVKLKCLLNILAHIRKQNNYIQLDIYSFS